MYYTKATCTLYQQQQNILKGAKLLKFDSPGGFSLLSKVLSCKAPSLEKLACGNKRIPLKMPSSCDINNSSEIHYKQ